jgi:O-antigen ligase
MSDITFTNELFVGVDGPRLKSSSWPRLSSLVDGFIFVSLVTLIALVAVPYGTVEQWWISLYELAVFSLGALWLGQGLITDVWNVRGKQMLAPILVLAAFTFLQSLTLPGNSLTSISADPFETRLVFLKLLALTMNAALLLRYTSTQRRVRTLVHVVIAVGVASAVFGIARQALQHNEAGFILPYLRRDAGFGQFVNKNHFALLMEMDIGLAMGCMLGGGVRRERLLLYIAAVLLMWTGLVLTSSRGGLFSALSQLVFLVAIWTCLRAAKHARSNSTESQPDRRESLVLTAALMVCLLAVVALSAVWIGGDLLVTRLESLSSEVRISAQDPRAGVRRREVWSATWHLIEEHPILGSGFGAYNIAITKFHDASGKWTPEAAHNDYLELLASGGLVGCALLIWFGCVFIRRARHQLLNSGTFQRAACLGALTGVFGVVAHSVVDFGLHVTANSVGFIALVVIATRDVREETSKRTGSQPAQDIRRVT